MKIRNQQNANVKFWCEIERSCCEFELRKLKERNWQTCFIYFYKLENNLREAVFRNNITMFFSHIFVKILVIRLISQCYYVSYKQKTSYRHVLNLYIITSTDKLVERLRVLPIMQPSDGFYNSSLQNK